MTHSPTFLDTLLQGLARLLPEPTPAEPPHAWTRIDSSWHTSSFELAQGLTVIEHDSEPSLAADTLPAVFEPLRIPRA